jgi:hypothetical protein
MDWGFLIPMPSEDTLRVTFDVTEAEVEKTIKASDAERAKAIVFQSPQLEGLLVLGELKAETITNQFRFTGKYYTGVILKKFVK